MSPNAAYYAKHGERTRHERRNQYQEQKAIVLRHYGGECEGCGENEPDVLTVDHIEGNGAEHRKEVPASQIHAWLIRNEFPKGFRVLCFNCNHRSRRSIERGNGPMQTIRNLQREVSDWADSVYPNRTLESVIGKLKEEYQELMEALSLNGRIDPLELADVLILALDGATLAKVDVQNAVREKVGINYERSWLIDPKTGIMSHKKDALDLSRVKPVDPKTQPPIIEDEMSSLMFHGGHLDGITIMFARMVEECYNTWWTFGPDGGCYYIDEIENEPAGEKIRHYTWSEDGIPF